MRDLQGSYLDGGTGLDNVLGGLALVLGEVFTEELAELDNLVLEALSASSPSLLGVEQVIRHVGAGLGHLEIENVVVLVLDAGELTRVDGIKDGASVLEGASLAALGVTGTDPAGVEQPGIGLVLLNLIGKHLGVSHGVQSQERLSEAAGEGSLGLSDTILSSGHLGGVARDEVEHGLGTVQLGDGRQDTAGIAGKQDDVRGHVLGQARDLGVADVLNGVGAAWENDVLANRKIPQKKIIFFWSNMTAGLPSGVLSQRSVVIVDLAGIGVEDNVLKD